MENFKQRFSLDYLLPSPEETRRKELSELFDRLSAAADKTGDTTLKIELKVIAALGQEKLKAPIAKR